jgi:non-ribosomal peptide synthetase component F
LPELSWQFADYAAWQRDLLQGEALRAQLEYWRQRIEIGTPPLCWPNDRPRPPLETHRAKLDPFTFSSEYLDQLQHMRKRAGASLFAALLAAFTALLHSYSGQQEIILGTLAPCGRHRTEFQKLLGYFMNPVPLQFRLSGTDTFAELMLQVQDTISGAISHADVPFEHVVKALGVQPSPGHHPLFQIAVSLAPSVPPLPEGWDMTPMDVESGAGRWDLYIEMSERWEYLLGRAQYNPDVFEQKTIAALLDDFRNLAKVAGAIPDHRITDLLRAANIGTAEKHS